VSGLPRLVIRRALGAVVALAALSVLIFAVTEVLPGDAVGAIAGPDATAEQRDRVRTELGLDRPAVERYVDWMGGVLRGDLGTAYVGGRPVADVLADRVPNSLLLAGLVCLLLVPTAVALGTAAGFGSAGGRRGRAADRVVSAGALTAAGIPEFVTAGLLLAVLATWLGLVPEVSLVPIGGSPLDSPEVLVLPVLSLLVLSAACAVRLIRASVADVVRTPYVEAARLGGIHGWRLAMRHVLPNALAPAVQAVVAQLGALVGGAIVVESIFNYPGVGNELRAAVAARDVPLVQGISLTLCAVSLVALLIGDLLVRLLSPRLRSAA
jgi:peptide/nickel transport system permease protein